MIGESARQGPHQTAQKSTRTGLSLLTTSCSQLSAVSSTTLAFAIFVCLSFPSDLAKEHAGPHTPPALLASNYTACGTNRTTHRGVRDARPSFLEVETTSERPRPASC